MRLLITGGAGFIGSNFIEYYFSKYEKDEIVCLDALTYAGNIQNLNKVFRHPSFTFVQGNICDKNLVNQLFNKYKFDIVINFAAETHVDNSIEDATNFLNTNILGVHVLLDACKNFNVYFHQISTDEVYGDKEYDDDTLFDVNSPLNPSNPYSASKAAADMLIQSYIRTFQIKATISRSSNNYGPHQHKEKFIPKCIDALKNNQKITIYGDGKNKRDWISVFYHCECIDKIIHLHDYGKTYNICSGKEYSNLEIAKVILKIYDKDDSFIEFVEDRKGHDKRYPMKNSF